jgi:hypothetical protein
LANQIVVFDSGKRRIMEMLLEGGYPSLDGNVTYHLFVNSFTLSPTRTLTNFSEMTAAWYAPQVLDGVLESGIDGNDYDVWVWPDVVFTASGAVPVPVMAFGYYVTHNSDGMLLWGQLYDIPPVWETAGDSWALPAGLNLGNCCTVTTPALAEIFSVSAFISKKTTNTVHVQGLLANRFTEDFAVDAAVAHVPYGQFAVSGVITAQPGVKIFPPGGLTTWQGPAGIHFVNVFAWGGGQDGTGSYISPPLAGAGGAGGGYAQRFNVPVTPFRWYAEVVGAGVGGVGYAIFTGDGVTVTATPGNYDYPSGLNVGGTFFGSGVTGFNGGDGGTGASICGGGGGGGAGPFGNGGSGSNASLKPGVGGFGAGSGIGGPGNGGNGGTTGLLPKNGQIQGGGGGGAGSALVPQSGAIGSNAAMFCTWQADVFFVDALIVQATTLAVGVDAVVGQHGTVGFTADAQLTGRASVHTSIDAWLKRSRTQTFTADAALGTVHSVHSSIDAALSSSGAITFTVDALVEKLSSRSFTVDAQIAGTSTKTFTITALTASLSTKSFTFDAQVAAQNSVSTQIDALLTGQASHTFTADAQLAARHTVSFTNDALLAARLIQQFRADAAIASLPGKVFTIDADLKWTHAEQVRITALLATRATHTFTIDADLKGTTAVSFTGDALLAAQHTVTFTANALIALRTTQTFTIDADLKATAVKTFTADALLATRAGPHATVDALLAAQHTKTFTIDALTAAQHTKTFTIDSQLASQTTKTFTITALAATRTTKTFTVDSDLLYLGMLDNFVGTNGTLVSAHTMDRGLGWTVTAPIGSASSCTIQSNSATISLGGVETFIRAYTEANTPNHNVYLNFGLTSVPHGQIRAVCRLADTSNFCEAVVDVTAKTLTISHYIAGTQTQVYTHAIGTLSGSFNYDLHFIATATTLQAILSGSDITTVDSGAISDSTGATNTKCGFAMYRLDAANYQAINLHKFQVS